MKKFLSILLVLTLVLSMGVGVFAVDYEDAQPVRIEKKLTVNGGVNPAETFNFTIGAGAGERDGETIAAPAFDPNEFTITVGAGDDEGSADINLPTFTQVGVYSYPITEIAGDTAGFGYDGAEYNLVVTVINNGDGEFIRVLTLVDEKNVKRDAFQNEFSAGDLIITKEITGNYAVFTDEFDVTVTLTPPEGKFIKEGPIYVTGAVDNVGNVSGPDDGKVLVTFKVTNDSTVTIANIPYGVTYLVEEDSGKYDSNLTDDSFIGTMGEGEHLVAIVNTLETQIETGINLDNAPYILILVGVAAGLVAFTFKRRVSDEK